MQNVLLPIVCDDGLTLGPRAFQVQLDIQPFNTQEIIIRLQPQTVEVVGIRSMECPSNARKTLAESKKYFLPKVMNEKALYAHVSQSNILTLVAPWV